MAQSRFEVFPLIRNSAVSSTSSDHEADVSPKHKNLKKLKIIICLMKIWHIHMKVLNARFTKNSMGVAFITDFTDATQWSADFDKYRIPVWFWVHGETIKEVRFSC